MRIVNFSAALLLFILNGCSVLPKTSAEAAYTSAEPDAAQTHPAWNNAEIYHFQPGSAGTWYREIENANNPNRKIREPGKIRFLWNENALYVGISMQDSDLTDESKADQTHIFTQSDCVELFLKSETCRNYWEIYGSAGNRKTCYHFPSRGRLGLESNNRYQASFTVKSLCSGTLNRWQDRDRGWKLLFRIPAEELTRHGAEWKPGSKWNFLLIRHNFSFDLPCREVTFFPSFSAGNPHFYEDWGTLELKKQESIKP